MNEAEPTMCPSHRRDEGVGASVLERPGPEWQQNSYHKHDQRRLPRPQCVWENLYSSEKHGTKVEKLQQRNVGERSYPPADEDGAIPWPSSAFISGCSRRDNSLCGGHIRPYPVCLRDIWHECTQAAVL